MRLLLLVLFAQTACIFGQTTNGLGTEASAPVVTEASTMPPTTAPTEATTQVPTEAPTTAPTEATTQIPTEGSNNVEMPDSGANSESAATASTAPAEMAIDMESVNMTILMNMLNDSNITLDQLQQAIQVADGNSILLNTSVGQNGTREELKEMEEALEKKIETLETLAGLIEDNTTTLDTLKDTRDTLAKVQYVLSTMFTTSDAQARRVATRTVTVGGLPVETNVDVTKDAYEVFKDMLEYLAAIAQLLVRPTRGFQGRYLENWYIYTAERVIQLIRTFPDLPKLYYLDVQINGVASSSSASASIRRRLNYIEQLRLRGRRRLIGRRPIFRRSFPRIRRMGSPVRNTIPF